MFNINTIYYSFYLFICADDCLKIVSSSGFLNIQGKCPATEYQWDLKEFPKPFPELHMN